MIQPLWKTVRQFLKILKFPYGSAIPLLPIYTRQQYTCMQQLVHVHRHRTEMETSGKWIDKIWYVHTMEYYSAIKKGMK